MQRPAVVNVGLQEHNRAVSYVDTCSFHTVTGQHGRCDKELLFSFSVLILSHTKQTQRQRINKIYDEFRL